MELRTPELEPSAGSSSTAAAEGTSSPLVMMNGFVVRVCSRGFVLRHLPVRRGLLLLLLVLPQNPEIYSWIQTPESPESPDRPGLETLETLETLESAGDSGRYTVPSYCAFYQQVRTS